MKNVIKRIVALFIIAVMVLPNSVAHAIDTEVIDEKWGKPIYVYGKGLSEAEIKKTAELLGIKKLENVNVKSVTGEDEIKYLGSGDGDSSNMISSVLVKKREKGNGVKIKIVTPYNISQITAAQYENASITAGVYDCDIQIAAVKTVTGESALTGIYKAFDSNGETLDVVRMQVAQKELETTNSIVQENKGKSNFDLGKFNQIIINVKQEINNYYKEHGQTAEVSEIEKYITESIEKYDLKDVISQEQIEKLVELFKSYQESGAVKSEEVKEQLGVLASQVQEKAKEFYKDAKESGLLNKIGAFFNDIAVAIGNLFK